MVKPLGIETFLAALDGATQASQVVYGDAWNPLAGWSGFCRIGEAVMILTPSMMRRLEHGFAHAVHRENDPDNIRFLRRQADELRGLRKRVLGLARRKATPADLPPDAPPVHLH